MTKTIYILHFGSSQWHEYDTGDRYYFTNKLKLIEFMCQIAKKSGFVKSKHHLDTKSFVFQGFNNINTEPLYCFYYENEIDPQIDDVL